jgi:hypothetical protein
MNALKRAALAAGLAVSFAAAQAQEGQGDVVYVPTPQAVVDEMLTMAKVGPSDFLIDLGSGDGRMVITAAKKFGARGFGVDLDTYLLAEANENARKAGVADRAQFFERNIFETRLDAATVITTYLLPELNLKLRPTILNLKPGTRVVAHDYHMGEWLPDEQKTIPAPGKTVGQPGVSYVFLWYVPAVIAGKWQSTIDGTAYEFNFDQLFQQIEGTMRAGNDSTAFRTKVLGDKLRFVALPKHGQQTVRYEFSGQVKGDTIAGTVKIGDGAKRRELKWTAKQVERRPAQTPPDDSKD